jgi:hypothetical protein
MTKLLTYLVNLGYNSGILEYSLKTKKCDYNKIITLIEATIGFEPMNIGFADPRLKPLLPD